CYPWSSPREDRLLRRRLATRVVWDVDLLALADHGRREPQDVLGHLRLLVAEEERHASVERIDHAPAVADDRVIDLAADRVLDVRDPDAQRRIGAVEHELDLAGLVAELLGHLEEEPHVLDARDFEAE